MLLPHILIVSDVLRLDSDFKSVAQSIRGLNERSPRQSISRMRKQQVLEDVDRQVARLVQHFSVCHTVSSRGDGILILALGIVKLSAHGA